MNQLSGTIPSCLFDETMSLNMLDLGQNNFSGHIPDSFGLGCSLQYLNLSNNTLRGKIPKSLESCEGLELMNVGNNLINDTFPCMLSSSLRVLVLRSNRFHGEVKCHNSSWPELQIVDISSNDFGGILKAVNFSSWRGMMLGSSAQTQHTELSYDSQQDPKAGVRITVKGLEVEIVKIFPDFTTIDFSSNNFHGEIPMAIGDLNISCTVPTDDDGDGNEKEKKREIDGDYVSAALGYGVGLGGFVRVLIFCRSFRYRYFGKIEEVVEEMFDARDRRRRRRRSDARRRRAVRDGEVRRL